MAHLVSVNVGTPREAPWATIGRSSIDKTSVAGPVPVRRLEGDEVSSTRHHGGPDKAVYAFAQEDLDAWGVELGLKVAPGQFGENLSTHGIDVNEAEVGSRWQVGEVLWEITSVRTPCHTFQAWQGHCGHDAGAWVKRFAAVARPGPYLRLLQEGRLQVGDEITVVHDPGHGVTVSTMFKALVTDRTLLPALLAVPDLVPEARATAKGYVRSLGRR
ncbi:MAG: MOSC domain-containing protein [Nocardioides sp.]|nr:MOSC domain-containing protein [Nocardioides sp.]